MSATLLLEPIVNPSGWSVYRIGVAEFPAAEDVRMQLRSLYRALIKRETAPERASVLLQYNQLVYGRAGYTLAENGKEWMPEVGLGYEPHKVPPTLWTREDFTSLGVGELPRPMMHQLFLVTTGSEGMDSAIELLAGVGPILLTRGERRPKSVLEEGTARFKPLIQEMSLKMFEWYLPLFNLGTYDAGAGMMRDWACGLTFYLRENPEDGGIVIGSAEPLGPLLEAVGAKSQPGGAYLYPAPLV